MLYLNLFRKSFISSFHHCSCPQGRPKPGDKRKSGVLESQPKKKKPGSDERPRGFERRWRFGLFTVNPWFSA